MTLAELSDELGIDPGSGLRRGQAAADGDQLGELFIGRAATVVPAAAGGLVEKLREALGAPPVEEVEVHRGHLSSLVTVSSAPLPTVAAGTMASDTTVRRIGTNA